MMGGRIEKTFGGQFEELRDCREFEINMEVFVPKEPRATGSFTHEPILYDLETIDMRGSRMSNDYASVSHYGTYYGSIEPYLTTEGEFTPTIDETVEFA